MEDETYRRILRIKALERWENEGGLVVDDRLSEKVSDETRTEPKDNFFDASHQDVRQFTQQGDYEHWS